MYTFSKFNFRLSIQVFAFNQLLHFAFYSYKKKEDLRQDSIKQLHCAMPGIPPYLAGNTSIKDMVDHSQSSGSGSGLPLLVTFLLFQYLCIQYV